MGYSSLPYLFVILCAPVVGIGVSRIESAITPVLEENTDVDAGECRMLPNPLPAYPRTQILRRKKSPKYYPPQWKPSKRSGIRRLVTTLYNTHLHEALPLLDGQLPPHKVLTHFFRCRGFAKEMSLDPRLLVAVVAAARQFKTERVEVISAYRSPKFNDALAKKGRHVAAESKHTKGMAMDVRFVGVSAKEVGNWLFKNFDGGVGTYTVNDFVHIDTGDKRRWRGR